MVWLIFCKWFTSTKWCLRYYFKFSNYNNTETPIMTKNKGTVGNGTYDYSLGSVGSLKLMIPNETDLVAKVYSGNVNWNLVMSPDTTIKD
jgi:hypothetical protein